MIKFLDNLFGENNKDAEKIDVTCPNSKCVSWNYVLKINTSELKKASCPNCTRLYKIVRSDKVLARCSNLYCSSNNKSFEISKTELKSLRCYNCDSKMMETSRPADKLPSQNYNDNKKKEDLEIKREEEIKNNTNKVTSSGTGFFIDNNGHIITNFHVVEPNLKNIKVKFDGVDHYANLISKDKNLDLALIKIETKNKYFIKITNKQIKKLQKIYVAGYPLGQGLSDDLKYTSGIVSSLKGFENNISQIQIDATLNMGNSGGPIVDNKSAELVAVAVSMLRNEIVHGINFGIKNTQVRDFLIANGIDVDQLSKKHKHKNLTNILERSTLFISC